MKDEYELDPEARMNFIFTLFGHALQNLLHSAFTNREKQGLILRVGALHHSLRNIIKPIAERWDSIPGGKIFKEQMEPEHDGCPVKEWNPVKGEGVADIVSNIWIDCCMEILAQVEYRQH